MPVDLKIDKKIMPVVSGGAGSSATGRASGITTKIGHAFFILSLIIILLCLLLDARSAPDLIETMGANARSGQDGNIMNANKKIRQSYMHKKGFT